MALFPATTSNGSNGIHKNGHTPLRHVCHTFHERLREFLATPAEDDTLRQVQSRVRNSLAVIQEALLRYPLPALSLSYNGGKDCLVLLILYLSALGAADNSADHGADGTNGAEPCLRLSSPLPPSLQSIYIVAPHPFAEVDEFVASSSHSYSLDLLRLTLAPKGSPASPAGTTAGGAENMREAFADYLARYPHVRAVLVGTRRTDPHGANLTGFDVTDGGWPVFMRVHPVIDWHYREIWAFIKYFDIPYCELYDKGYTSLGGRFDTKPNPALKLRDEKDGTEVFRPAYDLEGDEEERLGRGQKV